MTKDARWNVPIALHNRINTSITKAEPVLLTVPFPLCPLYLWARGAPETTSVSREGPAFRHAQKHVCITNAVGPSSPGMRCRLCDLVLCIESRV
jgi:hypothetical protein